MAEDILLFPKGSEYVILKDKELPIHCFRGPALDTSGACVILGLQVALAVNKGRGMRSHAPGSPGASYSQTTEEGKSNTGAQRSTYILKKSNRVFTSVRVVQGISFFFSAASLPPLPHCHFRAESRPTGKRTGRARDALTFRFVDVSCPSPTNTTVGANKIGPLTRCALPPNLHLCNFTWPKDPRSRNVVHRILG